MRRVDRPSPEITAGLNEALGMEEIKPEATRATEWEVTPEDIDGSVVPEEEASAELGAEPAEVAVEENKERKAKFGRIGGAMAVGEVVIPPTVDREDPMPSVTSTGAPTPSRLRGTGIKPKAGTLRGKSYSAPKKTGDLRGDLLR